jgi:hypothetical protein
MLKRIFTLVLILLPLWLSAQNNPFAVKAKTRYSASGMIGYEKVDSLKYYQLRLIQEFDVWRIGIGLDLDFLFDTKTKHLRKQDWDNLDDVIDKFYYIKYGEVKDPFYFHLGGFPGLTQGNGLIMQNYSNMLLYPEMRNAGVMIGGSPHWPTQPSFELFTSDIRRNQILSLSAQCKPMPDSTVKVLDQLILGMSFVMDRNQFGNLKYVAPDSLLDEINTHKKESAAAYGFGYTLPFFHTEKVILGQYAEIAHIQDNGTGFILPGIYSDFKFLKVNLEYRIYGKRYDPAFFDHDYEEERGSVLANLITDEFGDPTDTTYSYFCKEDALRSLKASQGWSGKIQGLIGKKLKAMYAWQNTFGRDFTKSFWTKIWVDTQYKRLENFSLYYNKTKVNELAITHVIEHNTEIGTSLTFRATKKHWYLIGSYAEKYKDKNGNGSIDWLKETKRSFGVGVKYVS